MDDLTPEQQAILDLSKRVIELERLVASLGRNNRTLMNDYHDRIPGGRSFDVR